jgi:uncharacterized damage-inducible protein DinB
MINQSLLAELKNESASTKKMLAAVPLDKADWQPHAKSMSLKKLAGHVAESLEWMNLTIGFSELDFAARKHVPFLPNTTEELLSFFDAQLAEATNTLQNATDETLMGNWTLRSGEQVFFTMPRIAVLRTFVFNHIVHHRAQLSVYLRLLDVPVPGMYGPTADSPM